MIPWRVRTIPWCCVLLVAACGQVKLATDAADVDGAASIDAASVVDAPDSIDAAPIVDAAPSIDAVGNRPPVVASVMVSPSPVQADNNATVRCNASDPDADTLTYSYSASAGTITGAGSMVTYTAPAVSVAAVTITCTVRDPSLASATGSATVQVTLPTDGLIGLWSFSGNTADSSGQGNNGVASGGPTFVADRFGVPGRALSFDGVDDQVTIANQAPFSGTGPFTIAAFITPGASGNRRTIFAKASASGFGNYSVELLSDNLVPAVAGKFSWANDTATGNYNVLSTAPAPPPGQLTHVAVAFNGTNITFFVNGVVQGAFTTVPAPVLNMLAPTIGRSSTGAFTGVIDDVRFYNRLLSPGEVAALSADR